MVEIWIKARYAGKCHDCECDISEGDQILYRKDDNDRTEVYCSICGEDVFSEEEIEVD